MNMKSGFKLIVTIICILMIYLVYPFHLEMRNNMVYGENKEELTSMQKAFFEISELKEKNNNLTKKDINDITDNFTLENTEKRELDVVNTYSYNNEKKDKTEKLSVFRSLDDDLKIEGVIYSLYNPKKDINVIRMQYHDLEKNNKYIKLEITTENINNIEILLNKYNPQVIKSELYQDYKYAFNMAKTNEDFTKDKLVNMKSQLKEVKVNSYNKQFKTTKGANECLLLDVDNSTNKLKSIFYDFGIKSEKYQDCINMISKDDLDKEGMEYYNLSKNCIFANTLIIFKENAASLKEVFLTLK